MLIIIAVLLISFIFFFVAVRNDDDDFGTIGTGFLMVGMAFIALSSCFSYTNYLSDRSFWEITNKQYREAVVVYKDYAVIDVEEASLTDFKYEGYQGEISKFVTDLRNRIVRYNESIVEKRIMDDNILFSWIIIRPDDDMKILQIKN